MSKRIFVNGFGLAITLTVLSLTASTAFAGNAPAPTQVVVTNTPAQPVPMVGLVKDSDASARKPFQWEGGFIQNAVNFKVTTVPANQRLVIEQVTGWCDALGRAALVGYGHHQWLSGAFTNGTGAPASTPVRFYVDPGQNFYLEGSNSGNTPSPMCYMTVTGYFVDLP